MYYLDLHSHVKGHKFPAHCPGLTCGSWVCKDKEKPYLVHSHNRKDVVGDAYSDLKLVY